jgi:hypothetical protein
VPNDCAAERSSYLAESIREVTPSLLLPTLCRSSRRKRTPHLHWDLPWRDAAVFSGAHREQNGDQRRLLSQVRPLEALAGQIDLLRWAWQRAMRTPPSLRKSASMAETGLSRASLCRASLLARAARASCDAVPFHYTSYDVKAQIWQPMRSIRHHLCNAIDQSFEIGPTWARTSTYQRTGTERGAASAGRPRL